MQAEAACAESRQQLEDARRDQQALEVRTEVGSFTHRSMKKCC